LAAQLLTDAQVRSLRADAGQRLVIYDARVRGLCLRVTARTKSWSFIYRLQGGTRQRRYTIGDYPAWSLSDARDRALELRRAVQDGRDPVTERKVRRDALTVAAMIDRFITRSKSRIRSWKAYKALLDRDVVTAMGDRPAAEVTRAEVANLLDVIVERAPTVANRVQNALSSVFAWAVSEGLVQDNPVRGLRKRHEEVERERVLTDEEVREFWVATEAFAPSYRDILRLVLLTAQRPGECAGIAADEIDLERALWVLPPGRTKNKRRHIVPLVGEALAIVQRLRQARIQGPLIASPRGRHPSNIDVAKAFQRLRARGIPADTRAHDLRRTAATLMGRLDIDQMTIARVLNHASTTKSTVTGSVYDRHTYEPQMRRALEALDNEIARVVRGLEFGGNVLRIQRGGGP